MIQLTDEMKELFDTALADGFACLVGTATKDGQPQISPKGSVMVFDDETLAYWERAKRSGLANLEENPKVVVYYSHPVKRIRWRFYGEASIHDSGPIREEVMRPDGPGGVGPGPGAAGCGDFNPRRPGRGVIRQHPPAAGLSLS